MPVFSFFLFVATLLTVAFAGARPVRFHSSLMHSRSFSCRCFFPAVATIQIIVFASARPVTMAIVCFAPALCSAPLRIFTGGRAMLAPTGAGFLMRCHLDNGNIPSTSAWHIRADAKTRRIVSMRIALRQPPGGRPMATPTAVLFWIASFFVGASMVIKSASAKASTSGITGRADAIQTCAILNAA